jgi:hypothetical protein
VKIFTGDKENHTEKHGELNGELNGELGTVVFGALEFAFEKPFHLLQIAVRATHKC